MADNDVLHDGDHQKAARRAVNDPGPDGGLNSAAARKGRQRNGG